MNQTLQTIRQRHSTRAYQQKQLPTETLEQILTAAIASPTAMNSQKELFTAVVNPTLLQRLAGAVRAALGKDENYCFFYNAPALVLVSFPADYPWARQDCGAAMENMFLAAQSLGVSSCWINQLFDQCANPAIRAVLRDCGVPEEHVVIASAALGYGVGEGAPTPHEKATYRIVS